MEPILSNYLKNLKAILALFHIKDSHTYANNPESARQYFQLVKAYTQIVDSSFFIQDEYLEQILSHSCLVVCYTFYE